MKDIQVSINNTFINKPISNENIIYDDIVSHNKIHVNKKKPLLGTLDGETYAPVNLATNMFPWKMSVEMLFSALCDEGFAVTPLLKTWGNTIPKDGEWGYRTNSRFISADVVFVDIDDGLTIDDLAEDELYMSSGTGYYTTPSHTPEEPRFRIVFVMDETITDPDRMTALQTGLIRHFGGDKACSDAVRLFYGFKGAEYKIRDKTLSMERVEELLALGNQKPKRKERAGGYGTEGPAREYGTASVEERQYILDTLKNTFIGNHREWFSVAHGLFSAGYTIDDFIYVTIDGLMENKDEDDCRIMWDNVANGELADDKEPITMGSVWHTIGGWGKYQKHIKEVAALNETKPTPQENLFVDKKVVVKPKVVAADSILAALEDKGPRNKIIVSPTGGGKSYSIARRVGKMILDDAAAHPNAPELRRKIVVLVSTKANMIGMVKELRNAMDVENLDDYHIDCIESTGQMSIGNDEKTKTGVGRTTVVAITTFAYVGRRGLSVYHYKFMNFIDARTHVFIDEVDLYVSQQTTQVQFGARYKPSKRMGDILHTKVDGCPKSTGSGNCYGCVMHKYDGYQYKQSMFGTMEYVARKWINPDDTFSDVNPHIPIEKYVERTEDYSPTLTVGYMKDGKERDIITYKFQEDEQKDFLGTMEDFMSTAKNPTLWKTWVSINDKKGGQEEVNAITELSPDNQMIWHRDHEITFPNGACNVLTLSMLDRVGFAHICRAESVIGLSATMTNNTWGFLSEHMSAGVQYNIPPAEEQKMERIIVIGKTKSLPPKLLFNNQKRIGNFLVFKPTKNKARKMYENSKATDADITLAIDQSEFERSTRVDNNNEPIDGEFRGCITHSLGVLGRGVNLPQYNTIIINTGIYKPTCAYPGDDHKTLTNQQEEDRLVGIFQNAGRILRHGNNNAPYKVIILEGLEYEGLLDVFVDEMSIMSKTPIEKTWIGKFVKQKDQEEYLLKICEHGEAEDVVSFSAYCKRFEYLLKNGNSWSNTINRLGMTQRMKDFSRNEMVVLTKMRTKYVTKAKVEKLVENGRTAEDIKKRLGYKNKTTMEKRAVDDLIYRLLDKKDK